MCKSWGSASDVGFPALHPLLENCTQTASMLVENGGWSKKLSGNFRPIFTDAPPRIYLTPSITWRATNTTTVKPMGRIPASLLYLAIYNPTLKPIGPIPDGDEDAEEQAQILLYTSRERAVSRDRMLRQVGLAKALVNFTECVYSNGE